MTWVVEHLSSKLKSRDFKPQYHSQLKKIKDMLGSTKNNK
jgi:hypothetical protein